MKGEGRFCVTNWSATNSTAVINMEGMSSQIRVVLNVGQEVGMLEVLP